MSLKTTEGLPPGVSGELKPESFSVQPGQNARAELKIIVSSALSVASEVAREFASLVLTRERYEAGIGLLLRIV